MPNLYLSYPAIPFDAIVREESVAFDELRPSANVISGERYQYASATAAASGVISLDFDLGAGNSQSVDHIIIANAQKLEDQGCTNIELRSSTDAVTYSAVWTDASFASATLRGTDSKDYIAHSLSLAAKRAWRFYMSGGAATTREINKVYFGTAWNPEVDCDWSLSVINPDGSRVSTEDGGEKIAKLGDSRLAISLSWTGVSDAALQIFNDRVLNYWQEHKFFLFTTDNHRILNDHYLLHVRCESEPQVTKIKKLVNGIPEGYSTITANFVEVRG